MADPVLEVAPLGFQWATVDPFLFCVHHVDRTRPAMMRSALLRRWPDATSAWTSPVSTVGGCTTARPFPAFPQHPHRGFETVTFVRRGFIDHSDSLGATAALRSAATCSGSPPARASCTARCSRCSNRDGPNPVELFQIWLNLPASDKMVDPYFTMLWNEDLPRHVVTDADGRPTEITVIAGRARRVAPPPPPPDSWASRPGSDLAIWHVAAGACRAS